MNKCGEVIFHSYCRKIKIKQVQGQDCNICNITIVLKYLQYFANSIMP